MYIDLERNSSYLWGYEEINIFLSEPVTVTFYFRYVKELKEIYMYGLLGVDSEFKIPLNGFGEDRS